MHRREHGPIEQVAQLGLVKPLRRTPPGHACQQPAKVVVQDGVAIGSHRSRLTVHHKRLHRPLVLGDAHQIDLDAQSIKRGLVEGHGLRESAESQTHRWIDEHAVTSAGQVVGTGIGLGQTREYRLAPSEIRNQPAQLLDAAQAQIRFFDVEQQRGHRRVVAELAQAHHQRQKTPVRAYLAHPHPRNIPAGPERRMAGGEGTQHERSARAQSSAVLAASAPVAHARGGDAQAFLFDGQTDQGGVVRGG